MSRSGKKTKRTAFTTNQSKLYRQGKQHQMKGNCLLNNLTIWVFFFFFLMALKKPCFSFSLVGSGGFMTIASAAVLQGKCGKLLYDNVITGSRLSYDILLGMSQMLGHNLNG